ncbi:MAG: phosphoribosyl-AMP cyclohydrolase [Betaproteobacteria bacterium]|jgi:phosphoribosyl-AMP cyclohydrolase
MKTDLIGRLKWNTDGLVSAIVQDYDSKRVLMQGWMNTEALANTVTSGQVVFWSRSRNKLWVKGEESGNFQNLKEIYVDCDGDALLLLVEQVGGIACHTGRESCFFTKLDRGVWEINEVVLRDPREMYKKS